MIDQVQISFSRSSGPGGQNVNKLNTKVIVNLPFKQLESCIPMFLINHFKTCEMLRNYRIQNGIKIYSQKTRSQHKNIEDALNKISDLLNKSAETLYVPDTPPEKIARISILKKESNEKRLSEKKYKQKKKTQRRITMD